MQTYILICKVQQKATKKIYFSNMIYNMLFSFFFFFFLMWMLFLLTTVRLWLNEFVKNLEYSINDINGSGGRGGGWVSFFSKLKEWECFFLSDLGVGVILPKLKWGECKLNCINKKSLMYRMDWLQASQIKMVIKFGYKFGYSLRL